jgi:CRISPR-associated endonuclease Csn1
LAYLISDENNRADFIFKNSFTEMLKCFAKTQSQLLENNKKIPYDWTLYYLRTKALTHKIEKEELAWVLLNFNRKRGYNQLVNEEEEQHPNKLVEFHSLGVIDVLATNEKKGNEGIWYNVILENGWIYRRTSKIPLNWIGQKKEFIVTTEINDDGSIKKDKEGNERRSFRIPMDSDWTLVKKKTEYSIDKSNKTVGAYIYESLLNNPSQKIKGKLVSVIERKFYKKELAAILEKQKEFHPELNDKQLYCACLEELYTHNEAHKKNIAQKDFIHLFLNDIIYYQRPLKSKKSLISNCKFEYKKFTKDGKIETTSLKCIAKSHPLYQEYRLWEFIQHLRIYQQEKVVDGKLLLDINVTNDFLRTEDDFVNLFEWLNNRKDVDQKALLKQYFKIKKADNYRWNYVADKIYPCNETRYQIVSRLSKMKDIPVGFASKENEEALWHILYSVNDRVEVHKALKTFAIKKALGSDFIDVFRKFSPFEKEYGAYSAKALKKLLPLMRRGKYWNEKDIDKNTLERIEKIITGEFDETIRDRVRNKAISLTDMNDFSGLPQWLALYIVYDRHSEDGEAVRWKVAEEISLLPQHSLRNPIVEQVINECLLVVKDVWKEYGNGNENFFDEIHIELGREMKNPAAQRKKMMDKISENENTNMRIKSLLMELMNDSEVENIRPYSIAQQEILKIYEEGILNAETDIPEDILKIAKQAQPRRSELIRYRLWLGQKYKSPYTGRIIPLNKLFTSAYEIEHIIPQSRYFDDSLSNKVICESEVNKHKDNKTAYEYIKLNGGRKIELSFGESVTLFTLSDFEAFVKENFSGNRSKMTRLLMEDIPDSFIQRQLNDSRYISKVIKTLMSRIVREADEQEVISKRVIVSNGSITATLRQEWGLNDVWNEIITPRFERLNKLTETENFGEWTHKGGKRVFQTSIPIQLSKGFNKKRIDHRHHALDAIIVACSSRNHINYLNNESALGNGVSKEESVKRRYDLKNTLCFKKRNSDSTDHYKWVFYKPWDSFTEDVKETLFNMIVSFKQNIRVLTKAKNQYQTWKMGEEGKMVKVVVNQTGTNWSVRKPLHKATVSGIVRLKCKKIVSLAIALNDCEMIVDEKLKMRLLELVRQNKEKKEILRSFKAESNKWEGKDISKVEVYYWDENVASRVNIEDKKFNSSYIESITDSGIRKIMKEHLKSFNEDKAGTIIEHPELAFSHEGVEALNENIILLNKGKFHQPIYKVRRYETKGNKFAIGDKSNNTKKYVKAAKRTNLFFAVYVDEKGKRSYETIPLNVIIERKKLGLSAVATLNESGHHLLFHLSPNDLVYVPTLDEIQNNLIKNGSDHNKRINNGIYKVVSFSGNQIFFIRNDIALPIVDKVEFSSSNKQERAIDGSMIKECCIKLKVDRLGNIKFLL